MVLLSSSSRGAIAVVMVFILIGVIHMPNGPFVRPHPLLWRLVLCVAILYILGLIFMLFQVRGEWVSFPCTCVVEVHKCQLVDVVNLKKFNLAQVLI